jgi:hypothetical protein
MKKIVVLAAVLTLVSAPVFATELAPDSTKAAAGAVLKTVNSVSNLTNFIKFSKGVYAGAQTSATGYALTTAHYNGTKSFGTGYDATAIYSLDNAGAVIEGNLAAPSSSVTSEAFGSGWTKL